MKDGVMKKHEKEPGSDWWGEKHKETVEKWSDGVLIDANFG